MTGVLQLLAGAGLSLLVAKTSHEGSGKDISAGAVGMRPRRGSRLTSAREGQESPTRVKRSSYFEDERLRLLT